jgi:hypothetical protein
MVYSFGEKIKTPVEEYAEPYTGREETMQHNGDEEKDVVTRLITGRSQCSQVPLPSSPHARKYYNCNAHARLEPPQLVLLGVPT